MDIGQLCIYFPWRLFILGVMCMDLTGFVSMLEKAVWGGTVICKRQVNWHEWACPSSQPKRAAGGGTSRPWGSRVSCRSWASDSMGRVGQCRGKACVERITKNGLKSLGMSVTKLNLLLWFHSCHSSSKSRGEWAGVLTRSWRRWGGVSGLLEPDLFAWPVIQKPLWCLQCTP